MHEGKGVRPLKEGMYEISDSSPQGVHLIGSTCRDCGCSFFPARQICLNCGKTALERVPLSTRGKLDTFTIVWQVPPGALVKAPYAIGRILLPEGVYVGSLLGGCDMDDLKIGMDMEIGLEELSEDEEGIGLAAFIYKPVAQQR
jgi:uncharacterized OB-fold protein